MTKHEPTLTGTRHPRSAAHTATRLGRWVLRVGDLESFILLVRSQVSSLLCCGQGSDPVPRAQVDGCTRCPVDA
jgi:hypothetical protein